MAQIKNTNVSGQENTKNIMPFILLGIIILGVLVFAVKLIFFAAG